MVDVFLHRLTIILTEKPASDGKDPAVGVVSVALPRRVIAAEVSIAGFRFDFKHKDHHVDRIEFEPSIVGIDDNIVDVRYSILLRDKNGDDRWFGDFDVLITAFLEPRQGVASADLTKSDLVSASRTVFSAG